MRSPLLLHRGGSRFSTPDAPRGERKAQESEPDMTTERNPGDTHAKSVKPQGPGAGPPHQGRRRDIAGIALGVAIGLLVLLDASYVLNAMDRQVFPVLVPAIRHAFGFSLAEGGALSTIFTFGVGIAGLPAGYMIDKYGRKNIILGGIAIFSLFTLLQAFTTGFADFAIYRILSGVGEGVQNAALFAALGALNFSYGLGAFFGPLFGAYLLTAGDTWRLPFWVYGSIGFLLLAAIAVAVPRRFTERDTGD